MKLAEIFNSIDGEGIRAGKLATFIRLAGCNLRCSYCDTPYALALSDGKEISVDDIVRTIGENHYITITGGEPLIHPETKELVQKLASLGYEVNIETNGSIDITPFLLHDVIITMDYKCPSSGWEPAMILSNLERLRKGDVLKFVVSKEDLPAVRMILRNYKIQAQIYLSPVFGAIEPVEIVEFMRQLQTEGLDMDNARVQLQLHKYIWEPNKRGV